MTARIPRRDALKKTALAAAAVVVAAPRLPCAGAQPAGSAGAPFVLPPLPYAFDALEPHVDARTMEIHHGRHHAAYVANLNKALASQPALAGKSIEDLLRHLATVPQEIRTAVRNNGGGHLNHMLFWQMMKRGGGGRPRGELAAAMDRAFGAFEAFQAAFTRAALGQFGSGWAWLTFARGKLAIEATPNQDSPLSEGRVPLLGVDVWEHAYYLKYQNRRADYVAAWFHVVDWDFVAERHRAAGR
ncbi:MAG: superoxide dismutase [Verrucomicrobia bacterium]|nr:superoxide dismutase [Verrucomicrobiota bacterium]